MMCKEWKQGLVHVYTGDGKGKTTAAVGISVRAAGAGLRVVFVQFMKGCESSELAVLSRNGVRVIHYDCSRKFVFAMNERERDTYSAVQDEEFAEAVRLSNECDLLVLDEILSAVGTGMIDLEKVLAFLETKPEGLEVVLTGREPPREIVEKADYLSTILCQKHPYEKGVMARLGIEY